MLAVASTDGGIAMVSLSGDPTIVAMTRVQRTGVLALAHIESLRLLASAGPHGDLHVWAYMVCIKGPLCCRTSKGTSANASKLV